MAFQDNLWWTRKSRTQAEKRLLSNSFQSQLLLLWYSFFSVSISIYYLKFSDDSNYASVAWVVYSVLTLCLSGFLSGLSFRERAALIKECYEALNSLYLQLLEPDSDKVNIAREYERIMGLCENHTDLDYYKALCLECATSTDPKRKLDRYPTRYHWLSLIFWSLRRYLMFAFLYALPVFIFIGLEWFSCE